VLVPLNTRHALPELEYAVRDSGARVLFAGIGAEGLADDVEHVIDLGEGYEALLAGAPEADLADEPAEDAIAGLFYTGGTTGASKGVMLTHRNLVSNATHFAMCWPFTSETRWLVAAPMFHMNATISVKIALAGGASIVLLPSFDARLYARAIARFRVTWLTSVPTMLALVARESELLGELDFSSVERVTMGSAPLTQALVDKVQAIFPRAVINNSYGTTEAGPTPFGPHPAGVPRPAVAAGYPHAGMEVELREGRCADEGVLYMRSPMSMEGYNNLPEKTAAVMRDGWYRSGDIMRRDADGFYYFVGRADDMFVVGGENVWPGEVERLIERLPGVHQALVVPVTDEIKGALPFAFVVRQPGAVLDEAAVRAYTIANGPAFAHPRFVEFIEAVPLAATNKPDRRRLTAEAERIAATRPRASRVG